MARRWQQISLEEAKRHPLYGIKNWLALYAFGILLGPLRTLGEFSNAAHEAGLTLSQLLNADNPTGAYLKATIAFVVTISALLLWLLFSKHRQFRVASIALLVLCWPAYFLIAFITGGTQIPGIVGALTFEFLSSLLLIALWVAYLQRSRRVRVTFENCVLVEKAEASAIRKSRMPWHTTQTTTAGNDAYAAALAEIEEGRLDKGVWARSFAESGGDVSKAKALYIKARAESIENDAVWVDTQPRVAVGNRVETVQTSRSSAGVDDLPKWVPAFIAITVIAGIVGYQQYNSRQVVAASPVQAPAPKVGGSYAPIKDQYGGTLVTEPVPNVQSESIDAKRPFTYEEATGQQATQQVERGPWEEYQYQDGVKAIEQRDFALALNILRPLAENGYTHAQWSLAWLYTNGQGVVQDFTKASKWFRLAAEQGHAGAQAGLGMAYSDGRGFNRDLIKALMWQSLGALSGNPFMVDGRDRLAQSMTPQQIAQAQQMARDCQQRNFKGCD
jgi:hypothetical protein